MVDCPENLYNLGVIKGLSQQELKLKDEMLDQFVFCQAVREADGIRIALEEQLTDGMLRYRMRLGGVKLLGLNRSRSHTVFVMGQRRHSMTAVSDDSPFRSRLGFFPG